MMNMYGPYHMIGMGFDDAFKMDSMSLYDNSPFSGDLYAGLRGSPEELPVEKIRRRHDGTSPLPLGMDWSPPPLVWDGRNSVWPHDFRTGWSYCVTIPSWTLPSESSASESVVLYKVLVGIQSPQGITTTREVLRRFSDFVTLSSDLRKEFPKKKLPPAPRKGLLRIKSNDLLEERRCLLEDWMTKVLSDIDISRSLPVAIFIELEAAVRSSFDELNNNVPDKDSSPSGVVQSVEFPNLSEVSPVISTSSFTTDIVNDSAHARGSSSGTKVKDFETEVGIAEQSSKANMQQAVLMEREQITKMLWDMNELRRKYLEKEARLKPEQDEKLQEVLQKHLLESDLDTETYLKLLVEVESLRSSHSEMIHELSILTNQKREVEGILHEKRQSRELTDATNAKLLHQCKILRDGLEECSVSFDVDSENQLIINSPPSSHAIDTLAMSDNRVGSLLAEVELLAQDVVTSEGNGSGTRDSELRKMILDVLADNARLRKRMNSVIRCSLTTTESS